MATREAGLAPRSGIGLSLGLGFATLKNKSRQLLEIYLASSR
ncbi:MAG: hypothetical protein WBB34_16830 [Xanthobacteraceae bacterium]